MSGHIKQRKKRVVPSKKEAHRLFWIVKGHLNATESCIFDCYDSYYKRVWYMEESYLREEGFEEAYAKLLEKKG
jgi:hypothetical protein